VGSSRLFAGSAERTAVDQHSDQSGGDAVARIAPVVDDPRFYNPVKQILLEEVAKGIWRRFLWQVAVLRAAARISSGCDVGGNRLWLRQRTAFGRSRVMDFVRPEQIKKWSQILRRRPLPGHANAVQGKLRKCAWHAIAR
jgi:hypothetical protein